MVEKFTELSRKISSDIGFAKDIYEIAYGFVKIASEEMGRAIR